MQAVILAVTESVLRMLCRSTDDDVSAIAVDVRYEVKAEMLLDIRETIPYACFIHLYIYILLLVGYIGINAEIFVPQQFCYGPSLSVRNPCSVVIVGCRVPFDDTL